MSAHTFDSSSLVCPVCHHHYDAQPHRLLNGFLTCPHCRQKLVVSWSGHYVRDPFANRKRTSTRQIRRASQPLARIRRDFWLTRHPLMLVLVSASILFAGFTLWPKHSLSDSSSWPQWIHSTQPR